MIELHGILWYCLVTAKTKHGGMPMKLKDRISWLMGTVQRSLFAHLDECLDVPLTEQEHRLVSILEIVQVEKFVPKKAWNQWLGRKLNEREALARSFAAKSLYKYPTTRALIPWRGERSVIPTTTSTS